MGKTKQVRPLHIILGNRAQSKLGEIDNIFNVNYHPTLNGVNELSFVVYKEIQGKNCRLWDNILQHGVIYVKEYDEWFEINVNIDDGEKIVKKVITATSLCEAELGQIELDEIEINTGTDISGQNVNENDIAKTVFYNPNSPDRSLLHRILSYAPNYIIKYVDSTLMNRQYEFTISDGTVLYDFLTNTLSQEVGCLFLFDSNERGIYVYDMEYTCECGYRKDSEFSFCPECNSQNIHKPYGSETAILFDKVCLGNNINIETDGGAIKNCFKVKGGDEVINAALRQINPSGSNCIYFFNDETLEDMPSLLVSGLKSYDTELEKCKKTDTYELTLPSATINDFNTYVINPIYKIYPDKEFIKNLQFSYKGYINFIVQYYELIELQSFLQTAMMPALEDKTDTTAIKQLALLTTANLSPVSVKDSSVLSLTTANNAILSMAKVLVDTSLYKVEIVSSSLTSQTWKGKFRITSYSNEEDVAEHSSNISVSIDDNYENFLKQKIDKAMSKVDVESVKDIYSMEDLTEFSSELKKHSLDNLLKFREVFESILLILSDESVSQDKDSEMYKKIYKPYYDKIGKIDWEINQRESQLERLYQVLECFSDMVGLTNEKFNLANYLDNIEKGLWKTFCAYRREQTYTNDNYTSTGLNNSELISKCSELLNKAKNELEKSGTKQITISGTLINLLLIKDEYGNCVFEPILDDFALGNFIRCKVDGSLYKMRLSDISIDYDNLDTLSVTFTDASKKNFIVNTMSKILSDAQSMASSFSAVTRQAEEGSSACQSIQKLRKEGLDSAQYNVFSQYSKVVMDKYGLLARNIDNYADDQYTPEQFRLNGCNLVMTNDNWLTTNLAIGKQKYTINGISYEKYTVNADTLIGGIMIAGDIYSANYTTDENGNIIKGNHFGLEDSSFELADGKIIYDNATSTLNLRDVVIDWNTTSNPSISNITGLTQKLNNIDSSINRISTNTKQYTDSKVSKLDEAVSNYLGLGGSTLVGTTYVISPYIGGGYLNIVSDDKRVIIDPQNLTGNNYIFQVHNGEAISFGVDINGNAQFAGIINTKKGGTIGGWNIDTNKICGGDGTTVKTAVMQLPSEDTTWVFAAGGTSHSSYSDCPFRVNKNGKLYATDSEISGKITVTKGGTIGNWKLEDKYLWSGDSSITAGLGMYGETDYAFYAGSYAVTDNTPFYVKFDGTFKATKADITGAINAQKGNIGGWILETGYLWSGIQNGITAGMCTYNNSTDDCAFYAGSWAVNDAPFRVNYDGSLIAKSGVIGGCAISDNILLIHGEANILDGTITADQIKANTITSAEIASNTITADEIKTGTITANEIASKTITGDEIAVASITADEIAAETITSAEIKTGSITLDKIYTTNATDDRIEEALCNPCWRLVRLYTSDNAWFEAYVLIAQPTST